MSYISVFLIAGLAIIAGTLYSLRREHIRVEYSVSWLAVGCTLTGLSLFPSILRITARKLGLDPQLFFLIAAQKFLQHRRVGRDRHIRARRGETDRAIHLRSFALRSWL